MTTVVRRSPAHPARVVGAEVLTPRMRRVTIAAEALRDLEIRPAQDLELLLREESGRRVKRRYTIRRHRPETGEADLDVLLHGEGAGAAWGAQAAPGDEVDFQGPRGKLELHAAPLHLLCGDESALPAIAAIAEALPDGERACAVIEIESAEDALPVAAQVTWVHRGKHPPGTPDLLVAAVQDVLDNLRPAQLATARGYLMGETRTMVALRALLEQRGLPHDAIFVKGYWNLPRLRAR